MIEQADDAVSAISCCEMSWLVTHGRIDLGCRFDQWLEEVEASQCVRFLPVTPRIASLVPTMPEHHKDPQDRLIYCHCNNIESTQKNNPLKLLINSL